jgi:hypothetical protein
VHRAGDLVAVGSTIRLTLAGKTTINGNGRVVVTRDERTCS